MALKGDRVEFLTDMSYFMNETAERGVVVIHVTSGSGASMDDAAAVVEVPDTRLEVTGQEPAGLLLNDVVNIDLTRQHINWHKDEVQQGGKVLLLRHGVVVTNKYSGTPEAGEAMHFVEGGLLCAASDYSGSDKIGRFLSKPDSQGYVKVEVLIF